MHDHPSPRQAAEPQAAVGNPYRSTSSQRYHCCTVPHEKSNTTGPASRESLSPKHQRIQWTPDLAPLRMHKEQLNDFKRGPEVDYHRSHRPSEKRTPRQSLPGSRNDIAHSEKYTTSTTRLTQRLEDFILEKTCLRKVETRLRETCTHPSCTIIQAQGKLQSPRPR